MVHRRPLRPSCRKLLLLDYDSYDILPLNEMEELLQAFGGELTKLTHIQVFRPRLVCCQYELGRHGPSHRQFPGSVRDIPGYIAVDWRRYLDLELHILGSIPGALCSSGNQVCKSIAYIHIACICECGGLVLVLCTAALMWGKFTAYPCI